MDFQMKYREGDQRYTRNAPNIYLCMCCVCLMFLDTEDSMNDHEDTNGSKESFREQDIYLPIANVARIMKNAIPQTGKVISSKENFANIASFVLHGFP